MIAEVHVVNRAVTIRVNTPDRTHALLTPGEARSLAIRLLVAAAETELNDLRERAGVKQFGGPIPSSRVIVMPHEFSEGDQGSGKMIVTVDASRCSSCSLPESHAVHS